MFLRRCPLRFIAAVPDEDARQIKRWKAIRRHVRQLQLACEPGDVLVPEAATAGAAPLGLPQPQAVKETFHPIRAQFSR
jgi:hypothetical protein